MHPKHNRRRRRTSCKQEGGPAWSHLLCLQRAALPCLHTHWQRSAAPRPAVYTEQPARASSSAAEERPVTASHTGASAGHVLKRRWTQPPHAPPTPTTTGPLRSGDVHSEASWRRQEIYTESSGPEEGCAHAAQAPASAARWVGASDSCCCLMLLHLASLG